MICQGDEICRMYWRMTIICISLFLSRGRQTTNLKNSVFVLMHTGQSLTTTLALFFLEHTSGRYYMRFGLFVKDYQTINLKELHFRYHAYQSYADYLQLLCS